MTAMGELAVTATRTTVHVEAGGQRAATLTFAGGRGEPVSP
jgi:hypothetical protein